MAYHAMPLLIGGVGLQEILLVLLLAVILFGGRKIPELARGLGRGISEFKRGMHEPTDQNPPTPPGEAPKPPDPQKRP